VGAVNPVRATFGHDVWFNEHLKYGQSLDYDGEQQRAFEQRQGDAGELA
jgi:hypothetical protein